MAKTRGLVHYTKINIDIGKIIKVDGAFNGLANKRLCFRKCRLVKEPDNESEIQ